MTLIPSAGPLPDGCEPLRLISIAAFLVFAGSLVVRLIRFEGSHVDGEAVLHIGLEQPLVGFIDLLDWNDLDVGGDVVCATEVEHLLKSPEYRQWASRTDCDGP